MDVLNSALQSIGSICSWSSLRAACALALATVFSVFADLSSMAHPSIPFLLALVMIDFASAAGIALHEDRFTWQGFRHGLGKFAGYSMIFIVTGIADTGIGINGWQINLSVAVSCYAISGEAMSCLRHIDHVFPGLLPSWVIRRLETLQASIERDLGGHARRRGDWRGYGLHDNNKEDRL